MWSIESIKGRDTKYDFLVGEEYIVGRKDCDILITGDQSISRKHAYLRIQHPEGNLSNLSAPSTFLLKETSKYGSSVNDVKLEPGSETRLKHGDKIIFGSLKTNEWRVKLSPLVVAASALPPEEKRSLKKVVHNLGGHMVSEWCPQCTLLVMTQLNVTIKVISALVTCRPIVTPDYCKHIVDAVKEKSSLPEPDTYQPPVMESAINKNEVSFAPNERRKTIFEGKTFFFLTQKQFKRLHIAIRMAGGRPEPLNEESNVKVLTPQLTAENACVLYTEHQDSSQAMSQASQDVASMVLRVLKKHKLRPIPESELGLAVLYVSTALHCNPRVAQAGLDFLSAVPSQSLPTQNVLASDTQGFSQQIHGNGVGPSRKTHSVGKGEAGSTSNLPKKNTTSTPKISKICESIMEMPSPASVPSRPQATSPEFSFQGNMEDKEKTISGVKIEHKANKQVKTTTDSSRVGKMKGKLENVADVKTELCFPGEEKQDPEKASTSSKTSAGNVQKLEIRDQVKSTDENLPRIAEDKAHDNVRDNRVVNDSNKRTTEKLKVKVKQEVFSQGVADEEKVKKQTKSRQSDAGQTRVSATNASANDGRIRNKDVKTELALGGRRKDEEPRVEKREVKAHRETKKREEEKKSIEQKQGTLDPFRKVKREEDGGNMEGKNKGKNEGKIEEVENKGKKIQVEEQRKEDDTAFAGQSLQVKDEPMDIGETEQQDEPLHRDQKIKVERRNGKRKSFFNDDDEDEVNDSGRVQSKPEQKRQARQEDDADTSMWKKKPRIDVFSQEEEEEADRDTKTERNRPERDFTETVLDIPRGFISARVPVEDQVNVKVDPDYIKEQDLPSNLVQVKHTALIVRKERNPPRMVVPSLGRGSVKNFKKFRKANYAGQSSIPRIIGDRDLFAHQNNPSKDIEEMFNEEVIAVKKQDKQEKMGEDLFAYEPKRAPFANKRKR